MDGWNVIPKGYGARFETQTAPFWLRLLFGTPFLDRFAYSLLVRRGQAYLSPHPGWNEGERDPVPSVGWRLEEAGYGHPGSIGWLRELDGG